MSTGIMKLDAQTQYIKEHSAHLQCKYNTTVLDCSGDYRPLHDLYLPSLNVDVECKADSKGWGNKLYIEMVANLTKLHPSLKGLHYVDVGHEAHNLCRHIINTNMFDNPGVGTDRSHEPSHLLNYYFVQAKQFLTFNLTALQDRLEDLPPLPYGITVNPGWGGFNIGLCVPLELVENLIL